MKGFGGCSLPVVRAQFERGETLSGWTIRALIEAAEELERQQDQSAVAFDAVTYIAPLPAATPDVEIP
jgi:hypothetical protein